MHFTKFSLIGLLAVASAIPQYGEWDRYRDERACRDHRGDWDMGSRRCREARHEAWEDWRDERSCLAHSYRWDRAHGRCGRGYAKREEDTVASTEVPQTTESTEQYPPVWRRGAWDDWRDRRSCEGHSYRWDVTYNRCAERAVNNAVGAIAGAVAGITDSALLAFGDRPACERAFHRWDTRYGRCY